MYCGHCGVDIEHLKDRSQGEQIKALITCRNKVSAKLAERDAEIERLLKRFTKSSPIVESGRLRLETSFMFVC